MATDWTRLSVVLGSGKSTFLPNWARALCEIGERMAQPEEDGKIRITVLSLPDLRYAASLVATGVAIAKFMSRRVVSSAAKKLAHEERIRALEVGASVRIQYSPNQTHTGIFLGSVTASQLNRPKDERFNGYFKVQLAEGGHIEYKKARAITIIDGEVDLKKNRAKAVRALRGRKFLANFLGSGEDAEAFAKQGVMQTAIVGSKTAIEKTIDEKILSSGEEKGCFGDIIRPQKYVRTGNPYSATILTSHRPEAVDELSKKTLVIYSGSLHFMKAKPYNFEQPTVVLLARKDPQFEAALTELHDDANFDTYDELQEVNRFRSFEGFSFARKMG